LPPENPQNLINALGIYLIIYRKVLIIIISQEWIFFFERKQNPLNETKTNTPLFG